MPAARLSAPDLDSGHGLRTLSGDFVTYNPYGYHIGSIRPHDTAIAEAYRPLKVEGLDVAGRRLDISVDVIPQSFACADPRVWRRA